MATTAVVAGTATAVSGRVARRQQARGQQAAEAEAYEQQQAAAAQQIPVAEPAPPPSTGLSVEAMEQLNELADLHEQGVLTDEEFTAQTRRSSVHDGQTVPSR